MADNTEKKVTNVEFYEYCIELNRHFYDEALKKGIDTVTSRVTVLGSIDNPVFEVNIRMRKA